MKLHSSRREFLELSALAGAGLVGALPASAQADTTPGEKSEAFFKLVPVGKVEKKGQLTGIRIFDAYVDALLGLEGWSHVNVFYWFDQNDVPQKRHILRVHPRGNKENPLTGVFACRAPFRPNLIALSVCKLLSVEANFVTLDSIDAFDGTPVLDLKPFIPPDAPTQNVRVPAWAKGEK